MSEPELELEPDPEHQVTPLELFFDLVFVFAITQVTSFLAHEPTWGGVFRGMLVLSALWWAWTTYAWLTSAMDVDEGGIRLAMLLSTAAMLIAAMAVPGAFGGDAVIFGAAYLVVRLIHFVLSAVISRDDPDRRSVLVRFAPTAILGASLILVAGFLDGDERIAVWVVALAIDYLGPSVIGMGRGWWVAPEHFAERHGLIILIALGESIIAIGTGAMVAGIVLFALGLKTTLGDYGAALDTVTAVALCGGAALYLLGDVASLFRATGYVFRRRTVAAVVLLALIPVADAVPALAALGLVSAVCVLVVAYEAIRRREARVRLRHPEVAA